MVEVASKNYQNQAIRITDLTVTSPVLEGYRFSNCAIYGPAVLVPQQDVQIANCRWDSPGGLDALFWVIEPGRKWLVGAIALIDTSFIGCSFNGIGLAGSAEDKLRMAGGFNDTPQA